MRVKRKSNYLKSCPFILATRHKVFASLFFFLTGSGNMSVSNPIAASTPEGSNYGAIGIFTMSPFVEVSPDSPKNRMQVALQPLITVKVGKAVII